MELITNGRRLSVAKSAADYLILNEPTTLPPGEAELIVTIDQEPSKFPFTITEPVNGVRIEIAASEQGRLQTPEAATA